MLERERPLKTAPEVTAPPVEPADEFAWPDKLFKLQHGAALDEIQKAFDRVYLPMRIDDAGGNREKAAKLMKITPKTLRERLKACGLGHMVRSNENEQQ